jgi:hypothetical protein
MSAVGTLLQLWIVSLSVAVTAAVFLFVGFGRRG